MKNEQWLSTPDGLIPISKIRDVRRIDEYTSLVVFDSSNTKRIQCSLNELKIMLSNRGHTFLKLKK